MVRTGKSTTCCFAVVVIACSFYLSGARAEVYRAGRGSPSSATSAQASGRKWWRLIPQPLPPEPASPKLRAELAARGAYFDGRYGSPWPLDKPPKNHLVGGSISDEPCVDADDPPFFADEAIVVATFKSYRVHLTPSHRSIYTSIKLAVEQVLEPGPSEVKPGQEIDQLLPGGALRLPDGRVLSRGVVSTRMYKDFEVKPARRYLLFLRYVADGSFFVEKGAWQLSDGLAIPVTYCYVAAARDGRAHYAGMSEADFLEAMREAIQKHKLESSGQ